MFLATVFALIAVSAASYQQHIPHILIATNPHNQHDVNRLCHAARQSQYSGVVPVGAEFGPTPFHQASQSSKATARVNDCCDRTSVSGKQQCLKNVRNDMLNSMCDQTPSGLCCGCEGLQKRMCIEQNPMYSPISQNNAFNFIDNQQQQDAYYSSDDEEDENEMMNANQCYHHSPVEECMNCNQCRRQIERATQVAAKQMCIQSIAQRGQNAQPSCCQAGVSVGASVGQSHSNVCVPAARKFQRKTSECGAHQNPNCAQAFVQCCRAAAQNEQHQFEQQMQENYEDVIGQGSPYASYF